MDGQNHAPVGVDETLVERADGNPQLALALDFSVKAQGCPNRCKLPASFECVKRAFCLGLGGGGVAYGGKNLLAA